MHIRHVIYSQVNVWKGIDACTSINLETVMGFSAVNGLIRSILCWSQWVQPEGASACEKPAHEHVDTQVVIIGQPRDSRKRVEVYSTTCSIQTRAIPKNSQSQYL